MLPSRKVLTKDAARISSSHVDTLRFASSLMVSIATCIQSFMRCGNN